MLKLIGDGLGPIFEGISSFFDGVGAFTDFAGGIVMQLMLMALAINIVLTLVLFAIFNRLFFKLDYFKKYSQNISRRRKIGYRILIFLFSNIVAGLIFSLFFMI